MSGLLTARLVRHGIVQPTGARGKPWRFVSADIYGIAN